MKIFINSLSKYLFLVILGIVISAYILIQPIKREGLEYLFFIPLSFSIAVFLFANIIDYHKGGIGLKIFYIIILIRYLVSPFLIAFTNGDFDLAIFTYVSKDGYIFAIVMTILELFVSCITINRCWNKLQYRLEKKLSYDTNNARFSKNSISLSGILMVLLLLVFIIARDHLGLVLSRMGFLFLSGVYETDIIYTYDIIAIQTIKSFLYIMLVIWTSQKYKEKKALIWPFLAIIAALLNISIFFNYNRSSILQIAIATIATLIFAFKPLKKLIITSLVPIVFMVMLSIITIKQFGLSANEMNTNDIFLTNISNTIEMYVCGMWTLGSSFDAYELLNNYNVSVFTIIRDVTDNIFLFKIPGFSFINDVLSDFMTTPETYTTIIHIPGAMLPLAGQMLMYGGTALVFFLDIIAYYYIIKLLIFLELNSKVQSEISNVYVYTFLVSIVALIMCYCLNTLLWSMSNTPFFLILLLWINSKFVFRKEQIYEKNIMDN